MTLLTRILQTYPLDTSKTRAQNNLLTDPAKASLRSASNQALKQAGKVAVQSSRWHGVEMIIIRSFIQNMIQMTGFERIKIWIDKLEFADGNKNLPGIERDRGKDTKKNKT